jgi:cyclopropane fatty-acyl-phospholipid synthase-like methyltransferase
MSSFNSKEYWNNRYKKNETSGAGSYGVLCSFKAEIINKIFKDYNINSIIDLGCGDTNQLKTYDIKDNMKYVGIDVSPIIIEKCKETFLNNNYNFYCEDEYQYKEKFDVGLSIDVTYHLIEDEIFKVYLEHLFDVSTKIVVLYSSNFELSHDSNNPSLCCPHVKHRLIIPYIEKNFKEWELIENIPNRYPKNSSAEFYIFKKKMF